MKKNSKTNTKPAAQPARRGKKPKTEIIVQKDRCKGCTYCVEFCPKDVLEMSQEYNLKGFHIPRVAHPEACISCEVCQYVCPDLAIFVHRIPENDGGKDKKDT